MKNQRKCTSRYARKGKSKTNQHEHSTVAAAQRITRRTSKTVFKHVSKSVKKGTEKSGGKINMSTKTVVRKGPQTRQRTLLDLVSKAKPPENACTIDIEHLEIVLNNQFKSGCLQKIVHDYHTKELPLATMTSVVNAEPEKEPELHNVKVASHENYQDALTCIIEFILRRFPGLFNLSRDGLNTMFILAAKVLKDLITTIS